MALPPPSPTSTSTPARRASSAPSSTSPVVGFDDAFSYRTTLAPASSNCRTSFSVTPALRMESRPVTTITFFPSSTTSTPTWANVPTPNLTRVLKWNCTLVITSIGHHPNLQPCCVSTWRSMISSPPIYKVLHAKRSSFLPQATYIVNKLTPTNVACILHWCHVCWSGTRLTRGLSTATAPPAGHSI